MFVRLMFLLLLALNLGAGAWLLFGRAPVRTYPPPADRGVTELRLLSETPQPVHPVAAPVAATTTAPAQPRAACSTLGAFTTTIDMRTAMKALSPHVLRIQYREEQVRRSHGFWVYLPAVTSREAALDEARQLVTKGVHDYYVVTAGDSQNTISLGLFNDQSNAQNRLAQLRKLGFPAEVKERVDTEPAYWVDFAVPPDASFEWQAWLPGRTDLHAKGIDCF